MSRVLLSLFLVAAAGCGGDAEPRSGGASPDAAAAPASAGALQVTVRYTGARRGPLVVGAFTTNPPMGPPLAFERVPAPSFPAAVELRGLEAGSYFVIATLDVEPASPTVPGPEDPTGASTEQSVRGGAQPVDVELQEAR